MIRCFPRSASMLALCSALALGLGLSLQPAHAQKVTLPDLSDYRTVDQAITTQIVKTAATTANVAAMMNFLMYCLRRTS